MPVKHIHLSQRAKDHLVKLKRWTGIQNWNVLCRWGFCASLAEPSIPASEKIPADSNVEMSWEVFAGSHAEIYLALLRERCRKDNLDTTDETLATQFRLHLHRGIAYLASDRRLSQVGGFLNRITDNSGSSVAAAREL